MVDLLTEEYDVVVRYQGGGNAGHTVINEYGKFALHLLPSGIFRKDVVNILGNGVALDPENLWIEIQDVAAKGVDITPENLKISDRASLLLPWHRDLDALEEQRLADKKYGSTKQGIAPFYSDKYQKKTVLAGELFYPEALKEHLDELMEWKNLTLTGVYGAEPYTMEMLEKWIADFCDKIKPFICDTGAFLKDAQAAGKSILFEAQLGSLRDLDYGIYPYTTSSNTTAAYAPIGSGLPSAKITDVVERHRHGYDVFPDSNRTQPFGSGATCFYPHGDLMIKNNTNDTYQLVIRVGSEYLEGEWRVTSPPEYQYRVVERNHEMRGEYWGGYTRHNEIYQQQYDLNGNLLQDVLVVKNSAIMMYEPFLTTEEE